MNILSLFQQSYGQDPRPTRMANLASKFGEVTICAYCAKEPLLENMVLTQSTKRQKNKIIQIIRALSLAFKNYKYEYWSNAIQQDFINLQGQEFDVILCHDLHLVPLACALKESTQHKKTKIIVDLREFYPKQFEQKFIWKTLVAPYYDYLCRKFLPKADIFLTVSPGLAKGYREIYNISCELIPSLSYYHEQVKPHATAWPVRCIHHGNASPGRKLESTIKAFVPLKGQYTLDLMLVSNTSHYFESLCKLTQEHEHINIIPPVTMPEIVRHISNYDLGVFLISPNTFNHKHTWPNKLFEFIQARLGIIVSPVPDMSELVRSKGVGGVTEDFYPESLTKLLLELDLKTIDNYKQKSHEIAEIFSWEENEKILEDLIFKT